jgi:hypothetical protein
MVKSANEHIKSTASRKDAPPDTEQATLDRIGYGSPEYQKAKKDVIQIIPQVGFWEAIDKYANNVALGVFGVAMGNIFRHSGEDKPLKDKTNLFLIGTAIFTALLGVYAHVKKMKLDKPREINHREQYTAVEKRMVGYGVGQALRPHLDAIIEKQEKSEQRWQQLAADIKTLKEKPAELGG